MGNPKAFMTIPRKEAGYRLISERIHDHGEVEQILNREDRKQQASRCMDCGIPFCHWACPLGNKMPEWQEYISRGDWKRGVEILHETNNFPEFTGRVCPAPCEKSCVLSLHDAPVTIRENEASVTEFAFMEGMIKPLPPKRRTGKRVAVIGSGPSGLAVAQQLNRKGHSVTVFEKDNSVGGLLRYGIPNFKLSKHIIDRRIKLMIEEEIEFITNTEIGKDISGEELLNSFDAICLAIGSGKPRDINPEGRDLQGIHFAMDFLSHEIKSQSGELKSGEEKITAKDKHVLVIGGGDTGSDCVGTSVRQGAKSVTQIEIMPKPPVGKNPSTPWPSPYPQILKTSSSHEEGCTRRWLLNTISFMGEDGKVKEAMAEEVIWQKGADNKFSMVSSGNKEILKADLVLLALGFVHPVHEGLLTQLGINYDMRGNVAVDKKHSSNVEKVFATGDAIMGASLVVKAIASGRKVAEDIHQLLSQQ
ncbi:MAG TPA: glutamate synthase subunit beta [Fermentimonas caenicola]|nr:glutamate synthase subunit beta [Lascolabacillus sp.]MBP6196189.1 glutamate synthase subunit beta [Fermentimonas sp.]MDI9626595.1 glutamate synthase subunit beta [Bacteroidota bacterium]TAH62202.1 MAG: glutamate synthase subunit beta [Fermentimonas caenicola]MBP7104068.1 glutamate synthase subunit beta [Fermentimonas sp.]MDD2607430.1 glutamate synthase subunit beta [Lascolabacillus sp.]